MLVLVARFSLIEMGQNFNFDRFIGYGESFLEITFCHSKVFRLHAILDDAAAALLSHSGKGSVYCYMMIGRRPILCPFGHLSTLLFCFYVKLSLFSCFKSFDF